MKRILIAGAGVAGLTAGILAQRNGFESEIFEKNGAAGGQCASWDRKGYRIDNCTPYMAGCNPGSGLHQLWHALAVLGGGVELLRPDPVLLVEHQGAVLPLWRDTHRLEQELLQLAPDDEAEIRQLMALLRLLWPPILPADKPLDLMNAREKLRYGRRMIVPARVHLTYSKLSVGDYAARFSHPLIRKLLTGLLPAACSASLLLFHLAGLLQGDSARPRGGSQATIQRMQRLYTGLGGRLHTGCGADRVLLSAGAAQGFVLRNGRKAAGDYMICACDPSAAIDRLLGPQYEDMSLRRWYSEPEHYPVASSMAVFLGAEVPCPAAPGHLLFPCRPLEIAGRIYHELTLRNLSGDGNTPPGCSLLECRLPMPEDQCDWWMRLEQNREDYRVERHWLALQIMDRVLDRFPGLEGKLRLLDVLTPASYHRICGAYKGSYASFILAPGSKLGGSTGEVPGLPNCYLTGQWIQPPGGLAQAALSAKFTIQRICQAEQRDYRETDAPIQ